MRYARGPLYASRTMPAPFSMRQCPELFRDGCGVFRGDDDGHADAHVEDLTHPGVIFTASPPAPAKSQKPQDVLLLDALHIRDGA